MAKRPIFFQKLISKRAYIFLEKQDLPTHYSITDDWLCGFILAEGSFYSLGKNKYPTFSISQHANDSFLIEAIRQHLGFGGLRVDLRKDGRITTIYTLAGKKDIEQYLLPRIHSLLFHSNISQLKHDWLNFCFPGLHTFAFCTYIC